MSEATSATIPILFSVDTGQAVATPVRIPRVRVTESASLAGAHRRNARSRCKRQQVQAVRSSLLCAPHRQVGSVKFCSHIGGRESAQLTGPIPTTLGDRPGEPVMRLHEKGAVAIGGDRNTKEVCTRRASASTRTVGDNRLWLILHAELLVGDV